MPPTRIPPLTTTFRRGMPDVGALEGIDADANAEGDVDPEIADFYGEVVGIDDAPLGVQGPFCPICKLSVASGSTMKEHETSIAHQIEAMRAGAIDVDANPPVFWHLSDSVGYQLLLKDGWSEHTGLGKPGAEGRKQPVKTALKLRGDRLGVGHRLAKRAAPLRVTHKDVNEVVDRRSKREKQRPQKRPRGAEERSILRAAEARRERKLERWKADLYSRPIWPPSPPLPPT